MRFGRGLVLLALGGMIGCAAKVEPAALLKIGQFVSLDGANRPIGQQARQGVEQAVADEESAAEGQPCLVLHVDDRGDTATVQAEAIRLLTANEAVALLADFDAVRTERLLRVCKPYEVAVVIPGARPESTDASAVLSLGVPPAVRGRLLARHAAKELHRRRAAVLTDSRRPLAVTLAASFLHHWPQDKDAASEEWTFATAAERDDCLARLVQTAPDVVLLACSVADFRALGPKLAEALPQTPLLYGGADVGVAALQAGLEARADVYLATAFSAEHLSEAGRQFARRYEARFHEAPDLYAAQSYDAARLLFDALRRAENPSRPSVAKQLAQCEQFDSVTGPMRWQEGQPRRRVFVTALQGKRAKVMRVVEPEEN